MTQQSIDLTAILKAFVVAAFLLLISQWGLQILRSGGDDDDGGGIEIGNGGQAVECTNLDGKTSLESYDKVETLFYNPDWKIAKNLEKKKTIQNMMQTFIQTLSRVDPEKAATYNKWWKKLLGMKAKKFLLTLNSLSKSPMTHSVGSILKIKIVDSSTLPFSTHKNSTIAILWSWIFSILYRPKINSF